MKIRVAVMGAAGRMGSGIVRSASSQGDMEVVAAFESSSSKALGRDIGEYLGLGRMKVLVRSSVDLAKALKESEAQVLVDFTSPEASLGAARAAAPLGVSLVIGTTGFSKAESAELEGVIKGSGSSAVVSPNMATGVNIFFKLVQEAARTLTGYDIEVIEAHHRMKKDSPSGTALRTGELIAQATGRTLEREGVFGRGRGAHERREGEIGFHAVRGGDIVGDHTVLFAGEGERLEITHRAHSRQAFVNGAIKAVRFLHARNEKGRIYTMAEVLGH